MECLTGSNPSEQFINSLHGNKTKNPHQQNLSCFLRLACSTSCPASPKVQPWPSLTLKICYAPQFSSLSPVTSSVIRLFLLPAWHSKEKEYIRHNIPFSILMPDYSTYTLNQLSHPFCDYITLSCLLCFFHSLSPAALALMFKQGHKCVPCLNHCFPVPLNSLDPGFRVIFLFRPHRSSKTGTQLTALLHCLDSGQIY